MKTSKYFGQIAELLLTDNFIKATKYLSERYVIKGTRKSFGKKIYKKDSRKEILFTAGTPNYEERIFIKDCKKAGEPFPIKKIQVQPYQKTRK